jgi:hypothetical protein
MLNLIRKGGQVGVALLLCGALHAGETGWSLGASANVMTDSTFGIAQNCGATLDAAYTWDSKTAGLPLRVSFGYADFPAQGRVGIAGAAPSSYRIGLQDLQISLDAIAALSDSRLKLFFGFTLNKWQVDSQSSYWVPDGSAAGGAFQSGSVRGQVPGIKLGLHLGLERPFTDHLSGLVEFQASSLGTSSVFMAPADPSYGGSNTGNTGVNPCWLQVGVRYHF